MDINPYIKSVKDFDNYLDLSEFKNNCFNKILSFNSLVNLDIGCGNGEYLNFLARKNLSKYYIGVELQYKEIYRACKRTKDLKNTKVIRIDANNIDKILAKNSIQDISIWFPDPWLKRKQSKHRLFSASFLNKLYLLQNKESKISIKTDNLFYFNIIYNLFKSFSKKFEILFCSYDYYGETTDLSNNYISSFERIFLSQNCKINYLLINRI